MSIRPLLSENERFQALVFDCDGTLINTGIQHFRAYNQALKAHGIELPVEFYVPRYGLTPEDLLRELAKKHESDFDIDELVLRYSEIYRDSVNTLQEISVVAEVARAHFGKVPMAVVSNGARENVIRSLQAVHLDHLFRFVVTKEDVQHGKPRPDLYLEASRRLGVDASACIAFEDTEEGITSARLAGMRVRDIREVFTIDWSAIIA